MKVLNNIIEKPWGKFYDLAEEAGKWHTKILIIKKGEQLSLQKHEKRSEVFVVCEGKVRAIKGKKKTILSPQKTILINKKQAHRLEAIIDSVVIEISFGEHDESDIVHIQDNYGRVSK